MSAETVIGSAAGVGVATAALVYDQNLAMASAGGMCIFLAVSAAIPLQERFWFALGSVVFGYIVGLLIIHSEAMTGWSAISAFAASALTSGTFGSLHKWANGGPTPKWILLAIKLSPFSFKKGGGSE